MHHSVTTVFLMGSTLQQGSITRQEQGATTVCMPAKWPFTCRSVVMGITIFMCDITNSNKVHLLCLLKVLKLSNSNSLVGTADFPAALVTEDAWRR